MPVSARPETAGSLHHLLGGERMYRIELGPMLLARLARLRQQTGTPIAHQVRDAVAEYCDRHEGEEAIAAQVEAATEG